MGLLGTEAFLSPISYRQESSLHDLLSVPNGIIVANQRRNSSKTARLKDQRGSSRLDTGPPNTLHTSNLVRNPTLLNFPEERIQDCYCLDPYHILLPDYITFPFSPGRRHNSWGTSLLCSSPSAWQSNKTTLSFSSIILSPYFCLALVHRDKILATIRLIRKIFLNIQDKILKAKLHGIQLATRFPGDSGSKESACNAGDQGLIPGLGRFPWRRKRQPTPVFLPGKSHGWRSPAGYSPLSHKELDTTEWFHFLFFLYNLQWIKEIQIKSTPRCHYMPLRPAKTKKILNSMPKWP